MPRPTLRKSRCETWQESEGTPRISRGSRDLTHGAHLRRRAHDAPVLPAPQPKESNGNLMGISRGSQHLTHGAHLRRGAHDAPILPAPQPMESNGNLGISRESWHLTHGAHLRRGAHDAPVLPAPQPWESNGNLGISRESRHLTHGPHLRRGAHDAPVLPAVHAGALARRRAGQRRQLLGGGGPAGGEIFSFGRPNFGGFGQILGMRWCRPAAWRRGACGGLKGSGASTVHPPLLRLQG